MEKKLSYPPDWEHERTLQEETMSIRASAPQKNPFHGIVSLSPERLGGYAPLLSHALDDAPAGTPVLLGYHEDGAARAALAAICSERSVLLRWISVDAPYRRCGIGSRLLEALCHSAAQAKANRIETVVCLPEADLPAAQALLLGHGFTLTEQNPVYCFSLADLLASPLRLHLNSNSDQARPLSQIPLQQLRAFNAYLSRQLGYPPIRPGELLEDASVFWFEKKHITGCLLAAPCGSGVEIRWLYATAGPAAILKMAATACAALAARWEPGTRIQAAALSPGVEPLIRRLVGKALTEEPPVLTFQRILNYEQ